MDLVTADALDRRELEKLFPKSFLIKHSCFASIRDMLVECKCKKALFPDTKDTRLDNAIRKCSCFNSWSEMYEAALEDYADRLCQKVDEDIEALHTKQ
ncbi:hypothetical protein ACMXYR_05185 [Neptuniibacter sp. QD29_5]|uniref:hypothetical protein n=1 Tax=Neptuniibacter sp. QD29_5 TaxID=3398207 RepID=UPI0039F5E859